MRCGALILVLTLIGGCAARLPTQLSNTNPLELYSSAKYIDLFHVRPALYELWVLD